MKRAGIAELKASLSELLERVKAGEEILVTDRGRPVARVTRVGDLAADVEVLVRQGILRPPGERLDVERLLGATLPRDPGRRALGALLEERAGGW